MPIPKSELKTVLSYLQLKNSDAYRYIDDLYSDTAVQWGGGKVSHSKCIRPDCACLDYCEAQDPFSKPATKANL